MCTNTTSSVLKGFHTSASNVMPHAWIAAFIPSAPVGEIGGVVITTNSVAIGAIIGFGTAYNAYNNMHQTREEEVIESDNAESTDISDEQLEIVVIHSNNSSSN